MRLWVHRFGHVETQRISSDLRYESGEAAADAAEERDADSDAAHPAFAARIGRGGRLFLFGAGTSELAQMCAPIFLIASFGSVPRALLQRRGRALVTTKEKGVSRKGPRGAQRVVTVACWHRKVRRFRPVSIKMTVNNEVIVASRNISMPLG